MPSRKGAALRRGSGPDLRGRLDRICGTDRTGSAERKKGMTEIMPFPRGTAPGPFPCAPRAGPRHFTISYPYWFRKLFSTSSITVFSLYWIPFCAA